MRDYSRGSKHSITTEGAGAGEGSDCRTSAADDLQGGHRRSGCLGAADEPSSRKAGASELRGAEAKAAGERSMLGDLPPLGRTVVSYEG